MVVKRVSVVGMACVALSLSRVAGAQNAPANEEPRPERLEYEEGEPIPEGYRVVRSRPSKGLVLGGAILGASGYGFAVMGAINTQRDDNAGWLYMPLAGPWLMLAAGTNPPPSRCPEASCEASSGPSSKTLAIAASGVVQGVGAALFITGMMTEQSYLQRDDIALRLVPASFGSDGYGLGAIGRF